jgi:hypothetical protein
MYIGRTTAVVGETSFQVPHQAILGLGPLIALMIDRALLSKQAGVAPRRLRVRHTRFIRMYGIRPPKSFGQMSWPAERFAKEHLPQKKRLRLNCINASLFAK